ncbi:hypothetical protein ART_3327 [Arthrobacter sp. PAMC 25486]|nr:hypothetical protein ART_3327 [Arthrobacter sp. PAMC 25486]
MAAVVLGCEAEPGLETAEGAAVRWTAAGTLCEGWEVLTI